MSPPHPSSSFPRDVKEDASYHHLPHSLPPSRTRNLLGGSQILPLTVIGSILLVLLQLWHITALPSIVHWKETQFNGNSVLSWNNPTPDSWSLHPVWRRNDSSGRLVGKSIYVMGSYNRTDGGIATSLAKFKVKGHHFVDPNLPSSHWINTINSDIFFDYLGPNATTTSFVKPIDTAPEEQDHDLFALVGSLGTNSLFVSWHSGYDGHLIEYTRIPCAKCSPPQSSMIDDNRDVYFIVTPSRTSNGSLMRVYANNGTAVAIKTWEDKAVRADQFVVMPFGFVVFLEVRNTTAATFVEESSFLTRDGKTLWTIPTSSFHKMTTPLRSPLLTADSTHLYLCLPSAVNPSVYPKRPHPTHWARFIRLDRHTGTITEDTAVEYTGYWRGNYQRFDVLDDGELTVSGMVDWLGWRVFALYGHLDIRVPRWVQLHYQTNNEEGMDPSPRELALLPREDGRHVYIYGKLPGQGKSFSLHSLEKP